MGLPAMRRLAVPLKTPLKTTTPLPMPPKVTEPELGLRLKGMEKVIVLPVLGSKPPTMGVPIEGLAPPNCKLLLAEFAMLELVVKNCPNWMLLTTNGLPRLLLAVYPVVAPVKKRDTFVPPPTGGVPGDQLAALHVEVPDKGPSHVKV